MRIERCLIGVVAAVLAWPVVVSAQNAVIEESSKTVSSGTIEVDAAPADVYALITDYTAWRRFLTDIVSVSVTSGGRRDAVVRMESRALGHEATLRFDNAPDKAIRFTLIDGPRGARASGEYSLVSINQGTRTRIQAKLYMDVVGVVAIFVTDARIRNMRQAKLRADLEDVSRWFRLQRRAAVAP